MSAARAAQPAAKRGPADPSQMSAWSKLWALLLRDPEEEEKPPMETAAEKERDRGAPHST